MTTTSPATEAKARPASRIQTLDWSRGWMLIFGLGLNSIIISHPQLEHARWAGVTLFDLIFPLFVTLSGCGMAFAFFRRVDPAVLARRTAVLAGLGLLINSVLEGTIGLGNLRFTGVLQMYAVLIFVVALLHLVAKTWKHWAILTVVFAVLHTAFLSVYALRCAGEIMTRECNPSLPVDTLVFGSAHIYANGTAGHDPEGLVAIFGALISAAAGATLGHLLLQYREAASLSTRRLPVTTVPFFLVIGGMVALALILWVGADVMGGSVPPMKRLWTAPFALGIGTLTAALLWLGQVAMPSGPLRTNRQEKLWMPLVALGRNSLLVYFGSDVPMALLVRPINGGDSVLGAIASVFPSVWLFQILWTVVWLGFWTWLAVVLHRRGIYIRP